MRLCYAPIASGGSYVREALRRVFRDPEGRYGAKGEGVRGSLAAYNEVGGKAVAAETWGDESAMCD